MYQTNPYAASPENLMGALIGSLVLTLIAYGAFPLLFAALRAKPITRGKYKLFCFLVNLVIMFGIGFLGEGSSSGGPYLIWTLVFSGVGTRMLKNHGALKEPGTNAAAKPAEIPVEATEVPVMMPEAPVEEPEDYPEDGEV